MWGGGGGSLLKQNLHVELPNMGVQLLDDHLAGGSDCDVRCVLRYVAILHGLRLLDGLLGRRLVGRSYLGAVAGADGRRPTWGRP